jgi:ribosomal protein S9
MQYIFLKNILETILSNYVCSECQNKTNEQSIQITGVSSHGVDIHVHCHVCGGHAQLNAEINTIAAQMLQNEE